VTDPPAAQPPTAEALRAHRHAIYAAGSVRGESGAEVGLGEGVTRADADAIAAFATAERPTRTLEVGLGLGLATLALCEALLAIGEPGAQHTVVDPTDFRDDAGRRTIREAGVGEMVTHVAEPSQITLPRLASEGRRFDLALIDGGHRFEDVFLDLAFADRLLEPGAALIVDDLWLPSVRTAVSYLETNLGYGLEPDALPDGFRRRRGLPGRRRWSGRVAVLRKPVEPPARPWDGYVPFGP
jgi:predicted O-methyltransferase YrrM